MNRGFAVSQYREEKAKKIEAVLRDFLRKEIKDKKILDVGAGSGIISEYFSKKNELFALDIEDQRELNLEKVNFNIVKDESIPFPDNTFDIVISNHVIEHVPNQKKHLYEIWRVLKRGGICYLATPNRIFPWEVHYKIPLLHYLPNNLFFKMLKFMGIYKEEVYLIPYFNLKKRIKKRFHIKDYTINIVKNPDKFGYKIKLLDKLPLFILNKIKFFSPTMVFILRK